MGLLWVILFIVGHIEARGLSFLISLVFTLQGPLVFFAFACTRRVRDLWRRKLSGATKRREGGDRGRCPACCCPRLAAGAAATDDTVASDQQATQMEHVSGTDGCTFDNPLYTAEAGGADCMHSAN